MDVLKLLKDYAVLQKLMKTATTSMDIGESAVQTVQCMVCNQIFLLFVLLQILHWSLIACNDGNLGNPVARVTN